MFKKRWIQREKLRAVHDNDLQQFLSSIGVLDEIRERRHLCSICHTPINIDNLGGVYPEDDKINFVCESLSCLTEMNLPKENVNE